MAVLGDQAAETRVAEKIALRVHRLGDAVGVEREDVALVQLDPILLEMRALGLSPTRPPRMEASQIETLRRLWTGAGLEAVEAREITVQRTFADFDDFWTTNLQAASIGPLVAAMTAGDAAQLKARVRDRLPADSAGRITFPSRANAVKGRLPT